MHYVNEGPVNVCACIMCVRVCFHIVRLHVFHYYNLNLLWHASQSSVTATLLHSLLSSEWLQRQSGVV